VKTTRQLRSAENAHIGRAQERMIAAERNCL